MTSHFLKMEQDYEALLDAVNRTRFLLASTETPTKELLSNITFNIIRLEKNNLPQKKTAQCNVTWKSGEIAYKCRECQFDATW